MLAGLYAAGRGGVIYCCLDDDEMTNSVWPWIVVWTKCKARFKEIIAGLYTAGSHANNRMTSRLIPQAPFAICNFVMSLFLAPVRFRVTMVST